MVGSGRSLGALRVVALSACVALAAGVGATGSAGAGETRVAAQGKVRIYLVGMLRVGPECVRVGAGRFRVTGAISDRGTFENRVLNCHYPLRLSRYVRVLSGRKGEIHILGAGPTWRVTKGTGAYAGLRGSGTQEGRLAHLGRFEGEMKGVIKR